MNLQKMRISYILCLTVLIMAFSVQSACATIDVSTCVKEITTESEGEFPSDFQQGIENDTQRISNKETAKAIVMGFYIVDSWQRSIYPTMADNIEKDLLTFDIVTESLDVLGIDYTMQKLGAECKVNLSDDVYLLLTVRANEVVGISMYIEQIENGLTHPMYVEFAF